MKNATHRWTLALAALGLLAGSAGSATAGPVLFIDDSSNRLGTVDVGTGAVQVIGSMGNDTMTDIAFSPTGVLFGISFTNLYRINSSTGAATLVGALGNAEENALVFGTNGTLYAAGLNGNLYTVNTATGAETLVGNIGFGSAGDLAFNGGTLFLSSTTNQLVRINLATGQGTAVGPLGFSNVFGLATGDNGVLYGVAGNTIFSVNTTTGVGTLVRTYDGGLGAANGTSFFAEAAAVPEPSSMALCGIAGLMGSGYAWRRRKAVG